MFPVMIIESKLINYKKTAAKRQYFPVTKHIHSKIAFLIKDFINFVQYALIAHDQVANKKYHII